MALTAPSNPTAPPSSWQRMLTIGMILIAIMAGLVFAFTLLGIHSGAHQVPVSIVASSTQRTQLETALNKAGTDAWDFHTASTQAEAVEQIKNRTVYGAFVVTDTGMR
ncbi:MAG: hypothetical protein ABI310_10365, partial [Microbacteriaceae bacterium]